MALPIDISQFTATIAPGASLSGPVPMGVNSLSAIAMPAAWTAAGLTYQVSPDGGQTWLELYSDGGVEVTTPVAAGQFVILSNHSQWAGINMVRVRSGTAASPVVQSAGAGLTLIAGAFNF